MKKAILFSFILGILNCVAAQTPLAPPLPAGTTYFKGPIVSQNGIGIIGCTNQTFVLGDASGCANVSGLIGPHYAFGNGATVDSGPILAPDGGFALSPDVVVIATESTNNPAMENGNYTAITVSPSSPSPLNGSAIGTTSKIIADDSQYYNSHGTLVGLWGALESYINSPNTLPWGVGTVGGVYLHGSGITTTSEGGIFDALQMGSGEIHDLEGVRAYIGSSGTGVVDNLDGYSVDFETAGNGSTITNYNGVNILSPVIPSSPTPDSVTNAVGIEINEQKTTNVMNAFQIKSDGSSQSLFLGPLNYDDASTGTPSVFGYQLPELSGIGTPIVASADNQGDTAQIIVGGQESETNYFLATQTFGGYVAGSPNTTGNISSSQGYEGTIANNGTITSDDFYVQGSSQTGRQIQIDNLNNVGIGGSGMSGGGDTDNGDLFIDAGVGAYEKYKYHAANLTATGNCLEDSSGDIVDSGSPCSATSTATLGSCGTGSPSLTGKANGFKITSVDNTTVSCVVNFSPSLNVGTCVGNVNGTGVGIQVATISTSSVTFQLNAGATAIYAMCQ